MDHPLRAFRKTKDMTQRALADELGVARETLARWELGLSKIDPELLPAVSEFTGIPKRDLRPDLAELIQ
jgi:transcriptional regulator with XRE-family HTH domain